MLSGGVIVAEIMLPIGVKGEFNFIGNHNDTNSEHYLFKVSGNAQMELALKNVGEISFLGNEFIVTSEQIDSEKANVISDLLAMGDSDQFTRKKILTGEYSKDDVLLQTTIDLKNQQRLIDIVNKYGWPGIRFAGMSASRNAFLVLQHASNELQHHYLPLLRKAVSENNAAASDLALLEDRERVNDGLPQIYGTQIKQMGPPVELHPIENEENVDKRREEIGLMPLVDYLKFFENINSEK